MPKNTPNNDAVRLFHALNVAFALVIFGVALIDGHTTIRLAALVGVVWLTALLIAPRLITVPLFARLQAPIQFIVANRKYFGLWAAAWLTAHGFLAVLIYFDSPIGLIAEIDRRPVIILELASLGILLLLTLLSNKWSIKHIRHWKHIQLAVWAVPAMAIVSSFVAAHEFLGQPPLLYIATLLLGISILTGATTIFVKKKQPGDWLRLAFLTTGVIAALAVLSL